MLGPSVDHTPLEELLLRLHAAVQTVQDQRDFTWRERALLTRLRLHVEATASRAGLTPAEAELVALVREGWSNKEIAAHLDKSIRTVKTQLTSVYKKFAVRSRSRLLTMLP